MTQRLDKAADVIDCDIGESERFGFRHLAGGGLDDILDDPLARFVDRFFALQNARDVNVHVVFHAFGGNRVGGDLDDRR